MLHLYGNVSLISIGFSCRLVDHEGASMRQYVTLSALCWTMYPFIALAQNDPDWSRREMERMQAQQERFDAQVERQKAQQERINAEQEREAMRRESQRYEQKRRANPNSHEMPNAQTERKLSSEMAFDSNSSLVSIDRIGDIFEIAVKVCRDESGQSLDEAGNTLTFNELILLMYYCNIYEKGRDRF